ncbi:hypothetical protein ACO0LM_14005 [Undibacterium sp. Di26W]|uniref:hypothetical protein n=1 Tax=Undibacterium sp. Di26W TaxID=3413035 RepID=UPI003BF03688
MRKAEFREKFGSLELPSQIKKVELPFLPLVTSITYEISEDSDFNLIKHIENLIPLDCAPYATLMCLGQTEKLERVVHDILMLGHVSIDVLIDVSDVLDTREFGRNKRVQIFYEELNKVLNARDMGTEEFVKIQEKMGTKKLRVAPDRIADVAQFGPDYGHVHIKITDKILGSIGPYGSPYQEDWVVLDIQDRNASLEMLQGLMQTTINSEYKCKQCELRGVCFNSFSFRKTTYDGLLEPGNCDYDLETGLFA